jgi:hypothetical protein
MNKLEIGAHLFFLGTIIAVVMMGALWSVELAFRVMNFVV